MNGKHGVLEVIDAEIASLPIMAEMMTGHDGDAFDAAEAVRRMTEARATVERMEEALIAASAKLSEMSREFNSSRFTDRYGDGPEMGRIADDCDAAIAAFRGNQS